MPTILSELNIEGSNLFLYVDPFGIKHLDMLLFDRLIELCPSVEILVNFNSFGFLREACRVCGLDLSDVPVEEDLIERDSWDFKEKSEAAKRLDRVMGTQVWRDITKSYKAKEIDGYKAECCIACCYAERLNECYKYVLNFPVRLKAGQRPKYRMLHACSHPDGTILMHQSMERGKESLLFMQSGNQLSLFNQNVENELILSKDIENDMLQYLLQLGCRVRLNEFYASFMTSVGITLPFKDLKNIVANLEKRAKVKITREPNMTGNNNPTAFMEESRGKRAWIEVINNEM